MQQTLFLYLLRTINKLSKGFKSALFFAQALALSAESSSQPPSAFERPDSKILQMPWQAPLQQANLTRHPLTSLAEHQQARLANAHYKATLYAQAIKRYEALPQACEKNVEQIASLQLARAYAFSGQLEPAVKCLQRAESMLYPPSFHTQELKASTWHLLAESAYCAKNYTDAIDWANKALLNSYRQDQIHSRLQILALSYLAVANRSETLVLQHKFFLKAERIFKKVLQNNSSEHHYLELAKCYLLHAKALCQPDFSAAKVFTGAVYPHKRAKQAAAKACLSAADLLSKNDCFITPSGQAQVKLLQAERCLLAYQVEGCLKSLEQAWEIFTADDTSTTLSQWNYLQAATAAELALISKSASLAEYAERLLWQNILDPSQKCDKSLYILACFYMHQLRLEAAEEVFLRLLAEFPHSEQASAALYWCAQCSEKLKRAPQIIQGYRKELFEKYAASPFAAAAYFHYYTYREYMQGGPLPIGHLKGMPEKFPTSPLTINAFYLIGLDHRRKPTQKTHQLKAIAAFEAAENAFYRLQKGISETDMPYYTALCHKAVLERALTNQDLGTNAQGIKRTLYLQQTEKLLQKLNAELENLSPIHEEALYAELQLCLLTKDNQSIRKVIEDLLQRYQSASRHAGYYLAGLHYTLGLIEMAANQFEEAWTSFMRAESADKGLYMSTDQRLDLWMQQALCYKHLAQIDKAMLILSRVINCDAVSSIRIQAMFLRAELYQLQGRRDLARKQLEAITRKGGEWALKAKQSLEVL